MVTAIRCVISGRVQGVWYRGWTRQEATSLGLDGWVRNLADGSVEAVFAGREETVREMVERCRRGPPLARVTGIVESPADPLTVTGFEIR